MYIDHNWENMCMHVNLNFLVTFLKIINGKKKKNGMDFHITHVKKECSLRGTNRTTVEKGLQILNTRCLYYVTVRVFLKIPIVSHIFTHTLTPTPTPICEKNYFHHLGRLETSPHILTNLRNEEELLLEVASLYVAGQDLVKLIQGL